MQFTLDIAQILSLTINTIVVSIIGYFIARVRILFSIPEQIKLLEVDIKNQNLYYQQLQTRMDTLVDSQMHLLRYRILALCERAINRNFIYRDELEVVTNLYTPYKLLDGNGVAENYVKKILSLRVETTRRVEHAEDLL